MYSQKIDELNDDDWDEIKELWILDDKCMNHENQKTVCIDRNTDNMIWRTCIYSELNQDMNWQHH